MMTEKRSKPEFDSSIERVNRRVTASMGRKSIIFDYLNTTLYEHAAQYEMFDHVFRVNDKGETGTYFLRQDFKDLWDKLTENNFPRQINPYPTPSDEATILGFYDQRLAKELEGME